MEIAIEKMIDSPKKLRDTIAFAITELEELKHSNKSKFSLESTEEVFKTIFELYYMVTVMKIKNFKENTVFSLIHEMDLTSEEVYGTQRCLEELSRSIDSWNKNVADISVVELNHCCKFFSKLQTKVNAKLN
jgi:hypothetical protein